MNRFTRAAGSASFLLKPGVVLRVGRRWEGTAMTPSRRRFLHLATGAAALPNLWGALGVFQGTLYQREQDGKTVYSTRNLPGSTPVQKFTVATPPAS